MFSGSVFLHLFFLLSSLGSFQLWTACSEGQCSLSHPSSESKRKGRGPLPKLGLETLSFLVVRTWVM